MSQRWDMTSSKISSAVPLSVVRGECSVGHTHEGMCVYTHTDINLNLYGGMSKNSEFIYKKLCIYSYTFKLQSPSKYSPLNAIHLSRCFFHCSQQFLNVSILMPFSASAVFYFTSSTLTKHFPLRTFLIWRNKKKSFGARSGE